MSGKTKTLGQVFTPTWVVDLILDKVGYTIDSPHILSQRILEPSFGNGAFLTRIVERLIAAARNAGLTPEQMSGLLGENVWGVEYDAELHAATAHSLNDIAAREGIPAPAWNLHHADALTFSYPVDAYDLVVGNPPYVRIHNMTPEQRASVKKFAHSTGTTDLYVIFYELGLSLLKPGGQLGYIAPNSYMYNTSQKAFRNHLLEEGALREVINFGSRQVFPNAATYTAVTLLTKPADDSHKLKSLVFTSLETETGDAATLPYPVKDEPWVFSNEDDMQLLDAIQEREQSLGDMFRVQYGVATLRDRIYTNLPEGIEQGITRPVVKASTYKGEPITQRILFPYRYVQGKPVLISEEELKASYPVAYRHLLQHKSELLSRDIDAGGVWYQYGRSQGLAALNAPKIVFSHIISQHQKTVKAFILPADTIVYSGPFITALPDGPPLSEALTALEGEEFCRYVKITGKNMSGGFKSFTTRTVKQYKPSKVGEVVHG